MGLIVTVVLNVLLLSVLMWCDVLQNWLMVIYCSLGVVLSSSYVFIDLMFIQTELMVDHDDFIFGSINLYVDVIRALAYMLTLCQGQ